MGRGGHRLDKELLCSVARDATVGLLEHTYCARVFLSSDLAIETIDGVVVRH